MITYGRRAAGVKASGASAHILTRCVFPQARQDNRVMYSGVTLNDGGSSRDISLQQLAAG